MVDIYFSKYLKKNYLNRLEQEIKQNFKDCKKIAVKIHFGEAGNKTALTPSDIKPIINILKKLKIDFFFYDSSTVYEGERDNPESHKKHAIKKGFGILGEIKTTEEFVVYNGKYMDYEVCKFLIDADGVLVITHFKGHICSGFGGSIKNIGMGALTKKSKGDVHSGGVPVVGKGCDGCRICEKTCPNKFIEIVNNNPEFEDCFGCSDCIYACPKNILKPKIELFDKLLADGALAAQSSFKKYYYVNIVKNITKECDCEIDSKGIIVEDIGYFFGKDAVALDKASYDAVISKAGENVFLKFNNKSGIEHIKAAEELGLGVQKYEIVEI